MSAEEAEDMPLMLEPKGDLGPKGDLESKGDLGSKGDLEPKGDLPCRHSTIKISVQR